MADVIYKRGPSDKLNDVTVQDGQILITADQGEMYVDLPSGRKKITDTNKVDKDGDKVLSTNDFTDEYKEKLDNIEDEATKTIVDTTYNKDVNAQSLNPQSGVAVAAAIAQAQLEESDVDLTPYVQKEELKTINNQSLIIGEDGITNIVIEGGSGDIDLTGYATETYVEEAVANKVDKETGKGLSENNYTTTEKNKLNNLPTSVKSGTGENSVVIGEGKATGKYSIAGGTNDISIGSGFESFGAISEPEARGDLSFSLGAGTLTLTPGSLAIGGNNISGCKGFYYWADQVDAEGETGIFFGEETTTIYLSTSQYKGSLSSRKWTASETAPEVIALSQWKKDNTISIVNNSKYVACATIISVNALEGFIEVTKLPFTKLYYEDLNVLERGLHFAALNFDDYSINNVNQPAYGVIDLGFGAVALGLNTKANGNFSHVSGWKSIAAGDFSHAEGYNNIAAYSAHAEGYLTSALGMGSHAEGGSTVTEGDQKRTIAKGYMSHAEGDTTLTEGAAAHAEGYKTKALGFNAHSEGQFTEAHGTGSHAEGISCIAKGYNAHAQGFACQAIGSSSHASGNHTIAGYDHQFIIGQYNDNKPNTIFEVGRGLSEEHRWNAFEVYTDGHVEIYQQGTTEASLTRKDYVDDAISKLNNAKPGQKTSGGGEIFNSTSNKANMSSSHAEGYSTIAHSKMSHAEGDRTKAYGEASHAEGRLTEAGANTDGTITGNCAHAEGDNTKATAFCSHSEGRLTEANHECSHAGGLGTITGATHQTVIGKYNEGNANTLFEIGNGTSNDNRHNIFEVGTEDSQEYAKINNNYVCTANSNINFIMSETRPDNAPAGTIWIQLL